MSKIQSETHSQVNIAKIMIPKVSIATLHADNTVRQGLELFRHYGYTAVPVLDENGVYIGSVTEGDFLRHILSSGTLELRNHEKYKVRQILREDFCRPLHIFAPITDLMDAALRQNFIPIVDDRDCLCGIVTRRSLIQYLSRTDTLYEPEDNI